MRISSALPLATSIGEQRHFGIFGFVQKRQFLREECFNAIVQDYHQAIGSSDLRLPCNELGHLPAFVASCMSEVSPSVIAFATDEGTMGLTESLVGHPVVCVHAFAYLRSEGTRWHSDNIDARYRGLKIYLNLDSVGANSGALRVIAGSHQDWLRYNLIPTRYETAEQTFELTADQLPATVLSSEPGDVIAFDLRTWHAVCGSRPRRRVIEFTYYQIPETPSEIAGFVDQMRAHQRQARVSDTPYYPKIWLSAGGQRHKRGLEVLDKLDLLKTGRIRKSL